MRVNCKLGSVAASILALASGTASMPAAAYEDQADCPGWGSGAGMGTGSVGLVNG